MFYYTPEGAALKNGFNFYPKNDANSSGFRFKLKRVIFRFRYSTKLQKRIVSLDFAPKPPLE
jgi:hypothetical protein